MRKFNVVFAILAAATAFTWTPPSQAVALNPRGLGQVLIFPYYTVNKGQVTLVSIANASSVGKMAKFRVKEGYNGREVLDFYVFLSAHDVWTAALVQTSDDGGGRLVTSDKSCTTPTIPSDGIDFFAAAYDGESGPADGGPTGVDRTREGSIEVIAFGDVAAGSPVDMAITHAQNGTPGGGVPACSTDAIGGNNAAGSIDNAASNDLSGTAAIVNVGQGTYFGYNATALAGFTDAVLFSSSSLLTPSLQQANSRESSYPGGAVAYVPGNDGRSIALDYANGIDAVSAVFMADAISNDYAIDAGLGAQTDWVVGFPTKPFYTDPQYVGGTALAPFVETFGATNPNQSNVHAGMTVYDREEGTAPLPTGGPVTQALPYEVNVVGFSATAIQPSAVLGSTLIAFDAAPYGSNGWARMDFAAADGGAHRLRPDAHATVLTGLPAAGFMVYNIINSNAQPGLLANYGGAYPHRSTISCSGSACP